MEEWGELANYLSSEIGQPVKLVPLSMDNLASAIENRNVDILLVNPVQAVIAKEKGTFIPIATLKGKYGSQFAGVIIAKKGNGITKAADLKGKRQCPGIPNLLQGHIFFRHIICINRG